MRIETLLSPGLLSMGVRLRVEAAKAISAIEINAARTPGGKTQSAATLSAFFSDCASKLSGLIDAVLPTVSARIASSATQITISFSEAMDTSVIPALSTFVLATGTGTGTPLKTSLAWVDSTHLKIVGTVMSAGNTVTYTAPAVSFLRDRAGNKLASFTGATA